MKRIIVALLILSCPFIPPAGATFTDERWHQETVLSARGAPAIPATAFTYDKLHGFGVTGIKSWIIWDAALSTSGDSLATVRVDLTLFYDGTELLGTACEKIRIERTIGDTDVRLVSFNLRCPVPFVIGGSTHTIEVRLVNAVGAPPILLAYQSFTLIQFEQISDTSNNHLATQSTVVNSNRTVVEVWSRLNTTCQKTTADDCEAMRQDHQYTNSLINSTHIHIDSHFNMTVNLTGIENIVRTQILAASQPVADQLFLFFWLALLGVAFLIVWHTEWGVPRFFTMILFALSVFVGMYALGTISQEWAPVAIATGAIGMAIASASDPRKGTDNRTRK